MLAKIITMTSLALLIAGAFDIRLFWLFSSAYICILLSLISKTISSPSDSPYHLKGNCSVYRWAESAVVFTA